MGARRFPYIRRSPTQWAVRGGLVLCAAFFSFVTFTHSMATALADKDAERAHYLAPGNGQITALDARARFLQGTSSSRREAVALARTALRQDPATVAAVTVMGLRSQLAGETQQARRIFAYAQRLSRRDLPTQIWAIEDAVGRNDIPGALRQYDIALRTAKNAPDLLFPILSSALDERSIRAGLIDILAEKPAWGPLFVRFIADNALPLAVADLYLGLRTKGVPPSPQAAAIAVNQLIATNAFDRAWAYYATIRSAPDRRASRDPSFTADPAEASILDWTAAADDNIVTAIQSNKAGGTFEYAAPPSNSGVVLRQTQLLPPGIYRLDGHSDGIDENDRALPYWVLSCQDGRELGRVTITQSAQAGGRFTGRLRVPANCPLQVLALFVRPSDDPEGAAGRIDRVRLGPVDSSPP